MCRTPTSCSSYYSRLTTSKLGRLPQQLAYDISTPESITLTVPRTSVLSDQPISAAQLTLFPVAGRVRINGTLLDNVDEQQMRNRGPGDYLTLIITLSNETWVDDLGQGANDATRAFALGITADATNTNTCHETDENGLCTRGGWMAVVQPTLAGATGYYTITRVSGTEVRLALPAFPTYDIFAPDVLNILIPPEAIYSNQLIVSPTQIRIEATQGSLSIAGGTLLDNNNNKESSIRDARSLTINLALSLDSWIADLGTPLAYDQSLALLAGLSAVPNAEYAEEANGWNQVVKPELLLRCTELACNVLTRVSAELLVVTVPQLEDYEISNPETIEVVVPRLAVLTDRELRADNTFVIRALPGTAWLYGTLVEPTRVGLPAPIPISASEVAAGAADRW